ncbi:MAG: serine protease, partial [Patescibacteria group bacterium]
IGGLPFASAQAAELTMATTLQENLDNVVYISCGFFYDDEFEFYASGSGVVIGENTILTNAHVAMYIDYLGDAYLYDVCLGGIAPNSYTAPDYEFYIDVVAYEYNDYYDYAFMEAYDIIDDEVVEYKFDSSVTYGNPDSLVHGDELTMIGYPGIAGSTITTTQGIVSGFNGHNWIKSDAVIDFGNSGGGAFDALGNLIGLPTAVVAGELNSFSYIQNLNAIIEREFGDEVIQRDYETLYTVDNIVCVLDIGCFNFGEGEEAELSVEENGTEGLETVSPEQAESPSASGFEVLEGQYDPSQHDEALIDRMTGQILLQVEAHGEAYYLRPDDELRYYMADGAVAYEMMRYFGLGITSLNLSLIPEIETPTDMLNTSSVCSSNKLANQVKGKILLDVERHGEAYYVYPDTCRRIYLKDGAAAYEIMRFLSKGITNNDLAKIPTGTQIIK